MVVHSPEQGRSEKDSAGSNPVYDVIWCRGAIGLAYRPVTSVVAGSNPVGTASW